jgi:hypothetical protein
MHLGKVASRTFIGSVHLRPPCFFGDGCGGGDGWGGAGDGLGGGVGGGEGRGGGLTKGTTSAANWAWAVTPFVMEVVSTVTADTAPGTEAAFSSAVSFLAQAWWGQAQWRQQPQKWGRLAVVSPTSGVPCPACRPACSWPS